MKVEIKQRPLKKTPRMCRLILYIYEGYTKTKEGKIQHKQHQKRLDLEVYCKPQSEQEISHNEEVRNIAEQIRAETYLSLSKKKYKIRDENLEFSNFYLYTEKKLEFSHTSNENIVTFKAAVNHLKEFTGEHDKLPFNLITPHLLESFKKYLVREAVSTRRQTKLKRNTANAYFLRIRILLRSAVKDEIIERSPADKVNNISSEEIFKDRLTKEDLKKLKSTNDGSLIPTCFLFMCYTGLRFSDVQGARYKDVKKNISGEGYMIQIKQKKTNKIVMIPLNKEAIKIIGINKLSKNNQESKIFSGLFYNGKNNIELQKWILSAGIRKNIRWHSARHTFGQLLHNNGVDIATIANLMGDTIETVMKNYVRISEDSKITAVSTLDNI